MQANLFTNTTTLFSYHDHAMKRLFLIILTIIAATATGALSQEVPVPVKIHVSLLKKVFTLSKNFQGKQVKIVVAFGGSASAVKDEVLSSFLAIGIQASACRVSQLGQEASDADVIYIAPGGDAAEKFCEDRGILSMTGMPSLTEVGKATVSIGIEAGKPKVFLHRTRAKAEKQEFSADLFRVAKIF